MLNPFEEHVDAYEDWFVRNHNIYVSELLALRSQLPLQGEQIEIGVGTGLFAAPLGIKLGVDPSEPMLKYARQRGIHTIQAYGEKLPIQDQSMDCALVVTTICFVQSVSKMLQEIHRILRPNGELVIGLVDRNSPLGQEYRKKQASSRFYRNAHFYSVSEVEEYLRKEGFAIEGWCQTLTTPLEKEQSIEATIPGSGKGAFVVVKATPIGLSCV